MTGLIPKDNRAISVVQQPALEDMHENLLLGITTLVRQASGIKNTKEFNLLYGRALGELKLVTDHIIILALERGAKSTPVY